VYGLLGIDYLILIERLLAKANNKSWHRCLELTCEKLTDLEKEIEKHLKNHRRAVHPDNTGQISLTTPNSFTLL